MTTAEPKPELLACPFCGGAALPIIDPWHQRSRREYWVACATPRCANGPWRDNATEANEAWNRRVPAGGAA